MKLIKQLFVICFCIFSSLLHSQVHVFFTSALIPAQYELRKEEYLRSLFKMKSYGMDPWIIEVTPVSSSFFDEYSDRTLYPQSNNLALRNKGVNETMAIRKCLPFLPFQDEDIVIKMTGRYLLYKRDFIDTIEATANDYDAFVCYGNNFVSSDHIFTGCFALRWKYFKKIVQEMDLEYAEREYVPVEQIFAEFIKENGLRVKITDPLYIKSRVFFSNEHTESYEF